MGNRFERDMKENTLIAIKNRVLQRLAMSLPGGSNLRVTLHRWRGVHIGKDVWIGSEALIETACPKMVTIGDRVIIGIRATILAHFQELTGVSIGVVTTSVPTMTVVQGNPARRVAKCVVSLGLKTSRVDLMRSLTKLEKRNEHREDQ